jgi:hypothetical protein
VSDNLTTTVSSIKLFFSNATQITLSLFLVLTPSLILHIKTINAMRLFKEEGIGMIYQSMQVSLLLGTFGTIFYIYQAIAFATHMGITYRTLVGHHLHESHTFSTSPEIKEKE